MKPIIKIFLFINIIFVLVGCTTSNPTSLIDTIINEINIPSEINKSINLPNTDKSNKATITWESSNQEILTNNGELFVPDHTTDINLRATIKVNDEVVTKDYKTLVIVKNSDKLRLAYINTTGGIKEQALNNLNFDTKTYKTYTTTFESLDQNIIQNDGTVIKSDKEQTCIIKITITNSENNETSTFYKKVIVPEMSNNAYIDEIYSYVCEKIKLYLEGKIDSLPLEHEKYRSKIEYISGENIFITDNGTLVKPHEYIDGSISIKITYANTNKIFTYNLENFGGNTIDGYLKEFLDYIMPQNITAHHNYVYDQYNTGELYLKNQVTKNEGAVLNLITGESVKVSQKYFNDVKNVTYKNKLWYGLNHRALSDSFYNNTLVKGVFGEGYIVPNKENIAWIVIHESGMPLEGQNAELLAKLQKDNVFEKTSPREASWHYQVDEGIIYQSFDDTIELWHAGGSQTILPNGNTSSIGIEMCINADGNYDGAMHQDAKLVATLLHKYNLNIKNVKRHYDFSGKECPSYMIRTNRYNEFLGMILKEYEAMKLLKDATVKWSVSNPELFTKDLLGNGLMYAKKVDTKTEVKVTLEVTKGTFKYQNQSTIYLNKDNFDTSIWKVE